MASMSVVSGYKTLVREERAASTSRRSAARLELVAEAPRPELGRTLGMRGVVIGSLFGGGFYLLLAVAAYRAIG